MSPSNNDRLTTGIDRLDEILNGGIPRHSVVFIAGLPGTGKTILSEQALFANAREGKKCLYFTTISEPPVKVLRFLQGFDFFSLDIFGNRVIYGDLGGTLRKDGPAGLIRQLDQAVRANAPDLVVIDSFKALRESIQDPLGFRQFTMDLAIHLSTWEVTTFLVGEYTAEDVREGSEFAVADGIIYLYGTEEEERQKRFLRIMKMRGTAFFGGEHFFDIGSEGITLYPRLTPTVVGEYTLPGGRTGSAIEGMTELLGGGIFESSSTLISGPTGSGKTLVALSFLVEGAANGQPGLLVTFEESPLQIMTNTKAFGWDLEDLARRNLLDVFHVSPSELNLDRHALAIMEKADRLGAKLVVIDSISAFEASVSNPAKYQSYLWAINDYFKRNGVTILMTTETKDPFGPLEISTPGLSFISDNIIFLRYVEAQGEITRVLGVLKMRGTNYDHHLRELKIDPPGLTIGPVLQQTGLLGATVRSSQRKKA